MIWSTVLTLSLSSTALLASIGAWLVTRRLWDRSLSLSSAKLSTRLSELEEQVDEQSRLIRNLRQTLRMRAYREQPATSTGPESAATTDPDAAAAEVRRQLNAALANGELKGHP